MKPAHDLDYLWNPRSVAIIGASDNPARFGGRPVHFLLQNGFDGAIYPVNPKREKIQGLRAYPSIRDIEGAVDCAIISVPTDDVHKEVASCAASGVRAAIIFSAGFAEMGPEGEALQRQLVETANKTGMRLLGPNCMGLFNAHNRFCPTFASTLEAGLPPAGKIALVSQSGGYGGYVLRHFQMRDMRLGYWMTTGNEADIDIGEVLHWMALNDDVEVIVGYLEGLRSSHHFVEALRIAHERRKPVIMMKVGRTAEGSEAAKSHTGSLTGSDAVYDCVFDQFGVHRARTTEELVDVAYAASKGCLLPAGRRVGIVSISGGVGVQMADYIADETLELSATPDATQQELKAILPACSPRNPIDLTGLVTADRHLLRDAIKLVLDSAAFDAVVIFIGITALAPSMGEPIRAAIMEGSSDHPDQTLMVSLTAPKAMLEAFDEAGFYIFEDPSRAIRALGALIRFREKFDQVLEKPEFDRTGEAPSSLGRRENEVEAKALLASVGIRSPRETVVTTPEDAAQAASEFACPVAVKIVSADIAHKSDVGGVVLDIRSPEDAAAAVTDIQQRVSQARRDAVIDGFLISEMVTGGVEMLLGMRRDPVFGPVIVVGLGGVNVELFKDVQMHLAPISVEIAHRLIEQLKSYPLLCGYRGGERADVNALAQSLAAFSLLAIQLQESVQSFEINPLVVLPEGKGAIALDAAIETQE